MLSAVFLVKLRMAWWKASRILTFQIRLWPSQFLRWASCMNKKKFYQSGDSHARWKVCSGLSIQHLLVSWPSVIFCMPFCFSDVWALLIPRSHNRGSTGSCLRRTIKRLYTRMHWKRESNKTKSTARKLPQAQLRMFVKLANLVEPL